MPERPPPGHPPTPESPLAVAVLKTVAYFDLFDYPLTTFEVWKWLWDGDGRGVRYADVEELLEGARGLPRTSLVHPGAFWCLAGREGTVATRAERHRCSIQKLRAAARVARLFGRLPWVEGVAACNSLGYRNARAEGDLDLFVITRPGAIWLTRFLTAAVMALAGRRPTARRTTDTVCLSFFVTGDALDLSSLAKPGGDPYFVYWVTQLTPLFGRGDVWPEFWAANRWVRAFLPNAVAPAAGPAWFYRPAPRRRRRGALASWADRSAKTWQERRLPAGLRRRAAEGATDVVVSDRVLKFHDHDRRGEYRRRWLTAQRGLGLSTSSPAAVDV